MEREDVLKIRNEIINPVGDVLVRYLSDYITKEACKNREASEIKGMCELLQQIKNIPGEVEKLRK